MPKKNTTQPTWHAATVKTWMRNHAAEHIDSDGEVNCTTLAEAACQYFDAWGPAPRYDCPDDFFDYAADIELKRQKDNRE